MISGAYLGLPATPAGKTTYETLLVSPAIAKVNSSVCVSIAYSAKGNTPSANGFIGIYHRQAGTQGFTPLSLSLYYNLPDDWNVEQTSMKYV